MITKRAKMMCASATSAAGIDLATRTTTAGTTILDASVTNALTTLVDPNAI